MVKYYTVKFKILYYSWSGVYSSYMVSSNPANIL